MVKFLPVLFLFFSAAAIGAVGPDDKQAFLKVSPLMGEIKTTKSGSGNRGILGLSNRHGQNNNTSKTITRNMKWNCEVRYRGKSKPEKVEVKVFYIGYEGKDAMTPKILGKDTKTLTLDENGKASVELESPAVKFSRTRTSSGGYGGYSGRIASSKTTSSGQRMEGCVVQLWEDGELVKSYASRTQWEGAAKNKDFSDAVLNRKEKNRLN